MFHLFEDYYLCCDGDEVVFVVTHDFHSDANAIADSRCGVDTPVATEGGREKTLFVRFESRRESHILQIKLFI